MTRGVGKPKFTPDPAPVGSDPQMVAWVNEQFQRIADVWPSDFRTRLELLELRNPYSAGTVPFVTNPNFYVAGGFPQAKNAFTCGTTRTDYVNPEGTSVAGIYAVSYSKNSGLLYVSVTGTSGTTGFFRFDPNTGVFTNMFYGCTRFGHATYSNDGTLGNGDWVAVFEWDSCGSGTRWLRHYNTTTHSLGASTTFGNANDQFMVELPHYLIFSNSVSNAVITINKANPSSKGSDPFPSGWVKGGNFGAVAVDETKALIVMESSATGNIGFSRLHGSGTFYDTPKEWLGSSNIVVNIGACSVGGVAYWIANDYNVSVGTCKIVKTDLLGNVLGTTTIDETSATTLTDGQHFTYSPETGILYFRWGSSYIGAYNIALDTVEFCAWGQGNYLGGLAYADFYIWGARKMPTPDVGKVGLSSKQVF